MASISYPVVSTATTGDSIIAASGSSLISIPTSGGASTPANRSTTSFIRQVAISPDEKYAATISDDKSLHVFSLPSLELLSTRATTKKCSWITFAPTSDAIIVSDRTGDCYSYPLTPREIPKEDRPTNLTIVSDPSKNLEADLLLGHVSVLTQHLITRDGKSIISADRDEHIRISRYPVSSVIERYLFGSQGFVSALHIPATKPEWLISGGGENDLRIWDWQQGLQIGSVPIFEAVLPHRRARSSMRRIKKGGKRIKLDEPTDEDDASRGFYEAPEGFMLPSGQGVCVQRIDSVEIEGKIVVLFHSEGSAAIHSFVLPSDPDSITTVQTKELSYPLLNFISLPGHPGHLLLSLDTAWGILKKNQVEDAAIKGATATEEQIKAMQESHLVLKVASDGSVTDVSDQHASLIQSLQSQLPKASPSTIASLQLYPTLSLLPRWPGFEEEDEMAQGDAAAADSAAPASDLGSSAVGKTYTKEEMEGLSSKQLGRMKSQGVDVGDILLRRKKATKNKTSALRQEVQPAEAGGAGEESKVNADQS